MNGMIVKITKMFALFIVNLKKKGTFTIFSFFGGEIR